VAQCLHWILVTALFELILSTTRIVNYVGMQLKLILFTYILNSDLGSQFAQLLWEFITHQYAFVTFSWRIHFTNIDIRGQVDRHAVC
jgi:hypothetical protein